MARRTKVEVEKRDVMISFRMSKSEQENFRAKATAAGLAPGEYMRRCIDNSSVRSSILPQKQRLAYAKLSKFGCSIQSYKDEIIGQVPLELFLEKVESEIVRIQIEICGL